MIQEMLKALMLIFVAEMGDKTQILAMAFATQFPIKKVLMGIGIGSFLNHGLAVLLGNVLTRVVPINTIQMIAGIAFVVFSLWTLKSDDYDEEDEVSMKFGPTTTVAIAFFIGELGDKTQLTAVTLAVDANYPFMILMGTVTGMILTGALGIIIGKKLGDKIPELAIKLIASSVFMMFGLQKLYETVPAFMLQTVYVIPIILTLALIVAYMIRVLFIKRQEGIVSDYNMKSKMLHDYYEHIQKDLEVLCNMDGNVENVEMMANAPSLDKAIIVEERLNRLTEIRLGNKGQEGGNPGFSVERVLDSLIDTLWVIDHVRTAERLNYAHQVRRELERILFDHACPDYSGIENYVSCLEEKDVALARRIHKLYRLRRPIEDRIINLGSENNNMYLVELEQGYIMIDTGLKVQYERFCKEISNHNIDLSEIRYVFITHAHMDHVGFLNEIIEGTDAKIILHPYTVKQLQVGENAFEGGFSNFIALIVFRFRKLLDKNSHQFDVVDAQDRYIVVSENDQFALDGLLPAKVLDLPGHTKDSIGLILENQVLFCGDAAANDLTCQYRIVYWIESIVDYKQSWHKMMDGDFEMVYPTHGKPFLKDELIKYNKKLYNIKLRK